MRKISVMDREMLSKNIFQSRIWGFEDIKEYILSPFEQDLPFYSFQAVGREHPCFILCDPFFFLPEYKPELSDEMQKELGADSKEELFCLSVVTVPDIFKNMTVNLKSPVVFNRHNYQSRQFVLDNPEYSVRHKLFGGCEEEIC